MADADPIYYLRDANIAKLALCKVGANQQRIFLLKSGDGDGEEHVAAVAQLIKEPGDDWRVAYVPVAVPGAEERPGIFGDQESRDVWESGEEIAKAAHSFMANGGQVVGQHFSDSDAEGVRLVENAVALADFKVGDTLIKEGTWYVGLEFDDPVRELVAKGEIDAVSIEGLGTRIAKGALERVPGVQNWIERLPAPMRAAWNKSIVYRAAVHMNRERGMAVGHAIASALNWASHICKTGDVKQWKGPQSVRPSSVAECCAAGALWESMKAAAHADNVAKAEFAALDEWSDSLEDVDGETQSLVKRIAKALNISADEDDCGCGGDSPDYDPDYIAKREFTADRRKSLAQKGHALSDGSYPIESCQDAKNARNRIGTGSAARATIVAHIRKREKELGCDNGPLAGESVAKGLLGDGDNVSPMDEQAINERFEKVETGLSDLAKSVGGLTAEDGTIAKMGSQLEEIAKRLPEPEAKPPSKEEIAKALENVAETFNNQLAPIAKALEALEEGKPSEGDDAALAKSGTNGSGGDAESKYDGILFP